MSRLIPFVLVLATSAVASEPRDAYSLACEIVGLEVTAKGRARKLPRPLQLRASFVTLPQGRDPLAGTLDVRVRTESGRALTAPVVELFGDHYLGTCYGKSSVVILGGQVTAAREWLRAMGAGKAVDGVADRAELEAVNLGVGGCRDGKVTLKATEGRLARAELRGHYYELRLEGCVVRYLDASKPKRTGD